MGIQMKSINDLVLEHAKENLGGTYTGLELLELDDNPKNYVAANLYVAALDVIKKLQKEIENLKS